MHTYNKTKDRARPSKIIHFRSLQERKSYGGLEKKEGYPIREQPTTTLDQGGNRDPDTSPEDSKPR